MRVHCTLSIQGWSEVKPTTNGDVIYEQPLIRWKSCDTLHRSGLQTMCVKNMHCFGGRGALENLREQRTRSRLAAAALRDCCGENWSWHLGLCHCARPGVGQLSATPTHNQHSHLPTSHSTVEVHQRCRSKEDSYCTSAASSYNLQPQQTFHSLLPRPVLSQLQCQYD